MGFEKFPPGDPIDARFFSVHVYQVRGFTVNEPLVIVDKARVGEIDYALAFGTKLNDIGMELLSGNLVEDEASAAHRDTSRSSLTAISWIVSRSLRLCRRVRAE